MGKRKILMIGLGLIGGSLAKNLAQSDKNYIIGYDTDKKAIDYAKMNGIVDEVSTSYSEAIKQSDFVILGTPISQTIEIMKKIDGVRIDHNVIVTDVSSVKEPIMEAAKSLSNHNITFVGGHPMAGSHKRGITAAKGHLFENAIFVLTPLLNCSSKHLESLQQLLENTKSHFVILHPDEHDEMTGVVSHFPHLIASSLVHQAKKWEHTHAYLPKLAAGGFRDITRIASSNPVMWQDIFYHNRSKMSQLLTDWIAEMSELKRLLENNDKNRIISYLEQAKEYRDGLGKKEKGAIPAFHDLYVDIRDQSGAIATVVQLIATENISINNIEILEIRDGITGVLRLSFPTKDAQLQSYTLLGKHGYELMIDE
ncbi:prephenate dehydrogenase [Virgibacillus oceani]|uniref:Prephenate dehydrogenase n=1 Tax=Virgibacillus oceani TaxID=1479511 RepID=A0A917H2A7_9BACI|nr:prephenate dehydrogenase [Virgibacillus oceani]GGG65321.1 prephenate dehydrogenase [Virgibacillus oceani]